MGTGRVPGATKRMHRFSIHHRHIQRGRLVVDVDDTWRVRNQAGEWQAIVPSFGMLGM